MNSNYIEEINVYCLARNSHTLIHSYSPYYFLSHRDARLAYRTKHSLWNAARGQARLARILGEKAPGFAAVLDAALSTDDDVWQIVMIGIGSLLVNRHTGSRYYYLNLPLVKERT